MARVCVIVYTDYAADTRVRRAAEALAERGDDVTVLCPQSPSLVGRSELSGVKLLPTGSAAICQRQPSAGVRAAVS